MSNLCMMTKAVRYSALLGILPLSGIKTVADLKAADLNQQFLPIKRIVKAFPLDAGEGDVEPAAIDLNLAGAQSSIFTNVS